MFDNHIHSSFSGDSRLEAEDACLEAIGLGLEGIAFTDHLDYGHPGFDETFRVNFAEYITCIKGLQTKFSGKLKVIRGIEISIEPHVLKETIDIVKSYDFDFVISSIHFIDGLDPYYKEYFIGKGKKEAYCRYLEVILESLFLNDDFDVIGHIGYASRYGCYDDNTLCYKDFSDQLDAILMKVISMGKGIEINSSGYRNPLNSPMPGYDIVRRYRELGGEIITVGSDAHNKGQVGLRFDLVKESLLDAGFKYTTHFEKRKPVFDII